MSEGSIILDIINEDGTSLDNFPKNPLQEKWDKLYPPISKPEYSQVCDGYSCMWCDRCPKGSDWEVPKEDLELWNKYQEDIKKYHELHNPNFRKNLEEGISKTLKKKLNK